MQRSIPTARLQPLLHSERGLTSTEAAERAQRYGRNHILEAHESGWRILIKDTARDAMVWFLVATSVLFGIVGERAEALILFVAVFPLIGMDWFLHRRTRASTEGLASRLAALAIVRRDDREISLPAIEVVPGDLAIVLPGHSFPADGILINAESVQADESALTGEAFPVTKRALTSFDATPSEVLIDDVHWTYAGTRLLTGRAEVRIVYTGGETLYGEIVRSASGGGRERTPLQSAIGHLVAVLVVAALTLCVVLAGVRLHQGFGAMDALLSALTLAVAALPEEFPVAFTIFLGVGVYRLAQRRALVRRAVVVENIGRVSCVCTDKTGTITEGQLRLAHEYPYGESNPERLRTMAAAAARRESGDPMDRAILNAATPEDNWTVVATYPFTEDRKRETLGWRHPDGRLRFATKGAPEQLFPMCTLDVSERDYWEAKVAALAETGHKVIAIAMCEIAQAAWAGDEPEHALQFVGLLAFEDPVRESVPQAVEECRAAGIHVLMITGDHPGTARAVAREIGLGGGNPVVVKADEFESWRRNGRDLRNVDVIARAAPSQKVDVVRAFRESGEIVAVTGDGVNDVPALQAADIGLAMGERGTRSAREAAAIVLLDDNFRTIVCAIAEGRQLFRNLKLSFAYLLTIHIPLVVTAALIPLAGFPLLYLPVHIVWMELMIHPSALLAFQQLPPLARLRPVDRAARARFFNRREWISITAAGVAVALMILVGYERSLSGGDDVQHARAVALAILSTSSATLLVGLGGLRTLAGKVIAATTMVAAIAIIQFPAVAALVHLRPLGLDDWTTVLAGALAVAAIVRFGDFRREEA